MTSRGLAAFIAWLFRHFLPSIGRPQKTWLVTDRRLPDGVSWPEMSSRTRDIASGSNTVEAVLEQTVIEAASWRLAASLARRHPELEVRREHPGGGQYDVLALRTGHGCTMMLNREGTVQVHGRDDGQAVSWEPLSWDSVVRRSLPQVVAAVEQAAGLASVDRAPQSTPPVLVYRTISALANLHFLADEIDICMGATDTSGYGGGPAEWLRDFPDIQARIDQIDGVGREPRFNYWHASARDFSVAFETTSSDAWSGTNRKLTISKAYGDLGRSMPRLLSAVLDLGAESERDSTGID